MGLSAIDYIYLISKGKNIQASSQSFRFCLAKATAGGDTYGLVRVRNGGEGRAVNEFHP